MKWHCSRNGSTFGPFTSSQLRDLASVGRLVPTDYVRSDNETAWRPASSIPGLFIHSAAPPIVPPPASATPVAQGLALPPAVARTGMSRQRGAVAICSTVGMFGTFLPWVQAPFLGSVNGARGDGWITFGLFTVALVLSLAGKRPFARPEQFVAALCAVGAAGLGGWKIYQFQTIFGEMAAKGSDNPFTMAFAGTVSIGTGLFVIIGAGVALVLSLFVVND
jgi:hypothetical protein